MSHSTADIKLTQRTANTARPASRNEWLAIDRWEELKTVAVTSVVMGVLGAGVGLVLYGISG